MGSVWRILKQVWGFISSLDHLKPTVPLKGSIRASFSWDFRREG